MKIFEFLFFEKKVVF